MCLHEAFRMFFPERASSFQLVACARRRESLVGILLFCRKGVFVQPIEKLFTVSRDHRRLREMDVTIDETCRYQSVLGISCDSCTNWKFGLNLTCRPEVCDFPVSHRDDCV